MKTKSIFFGLLALSMAMFSCNKENGAANAEQDFSAEEMFKGVVYNEGPVSNYVPALNEYMIKPEELVNDPKILNEIKQIRADVLAEIKKADPGFLESFKSKLRSKDPLIIKEALKEAGTAVYNATLKLRGINTPEEKLQLKQRLLDAPQLAVVGDDGKFDRTKTKNNMRALLLKQMSGGDDASYQPNCIVEFVAVFVGVIAAVVVEVYVITDVEVEVTDGSERLSSGTEMSVSSNLMKENLISSLAKSF